MPTIKIIHLTSFEVLTELDCADTSKMTVGQFADAFLEKASQRYRFAINSSPNSIRYKLQDEITPADFIFYCFGIRFDASNRYGGNHGTQALSKFIPITLQTCNVYTHLSVYGIRNYCLNGDIKIVKLNQQTPAPQIEQPSQQTDKMMDEISISETDIISRPSTTQNSSPVTTTSNQYNYAEKQLFWQNIQNRTQQLDPVTTKQKIERSPSANTPQALPFWKEIGNATRQAIMKSLPHTPNADTSHFSRVKSYWKAKDEFATQSRLARK